MANIVQQMGARSKKESRKWRKHEKKKLQAIEHAFGVKK